MTLATTLRNLAERATKRGWTRDQFGNLCSGHENDAALIVELVNNLPAIIAALEASEWRDITSAPPNVSVLLGWRDWRDGKWLTEVAPYETGKRTGLYSNVCWHGSATHWMPLSTPPEKMK